VSYVDPAEIEAHLKARVVVEAPRKRIRATPFVLTDPTTIPPREAVYGRHFVRKYVGGTVAPGGLGKSSNALVEAFAIATGRDLLGVPARDPLRVWYWCGEDDLGELNRRAASIALHYQIGEGDLGGRLFIDSGRDCEIVIATESRDGMVIAEPVIAELEQAIVEDQIDVVIIDPFVSCHEVSENDNNKIGRIMRELALLADRTNTALEVVHHVRKAGIGAAEVTVDDARGGKAFSDRCRSVRTLNRMSAEEALEFAVNEHRAKSLFRIDIGKSNLFAPARNAVWREIVDVSLGNATAKKPDDHVGVVTRWEPPSLFHGLTNSNILRIQEEIDRAGDYRASAQANRWVGKAVASVLDWNIQDATVKKRIGAMVAVWMKNQLLEAYDGPDEKREIRTFVRVKNWMQP
jgi:hypothetical protein